MNLITIIGILASCLSAASSLPQLIKIIKEKKSKDVSIGMLVVLLVGLIVWICYGIMKKDPIIIISNSISLIINIATTIFSLKYKEK